MEAKEVFNLYRRDKTRLTRQSRWKPSYTPRSWQFLFSHASDIAEPPMVSHVRTLPIISTSFSYNISAAYHTANSVGLPYLPGTLPIPKNDWSAVLEEVKKLKGLKTNWDGYGGQPISKEIASTATELVKVLSKHTAIRPIIVAMSSGHIQFEWHSGSKVLEFEVEEGKNIHYLKWFPSQNTEEESFVSIESESAVRDLLDWFELGTAQSDG